MGPRLATICVVLSAVATGCATARYDDARPVRVPERIAQLRERAARDLATPAGRAYDDALPVSLARDALHACFETEPLVAGEEIVVVVVLSPLGIVDSYAWAPATPIARCVAGELRRRTFPTPPFAPFHQPVRITFEQQVVEEREHDEERRLIPRKHAVTPPAAR